MSFLRYAAWLTVNSLLAFVPAIGAKITHTDCTFTQALIVGFGVMIMATVLQAEHRSRP